MDASDLSASALQVARINIRKYRVEKRVRPIRSDLFESLQRRTYDLIVCNPPYISTGRLGKDRAALLEHEPREAFDALLKVFEEPPPGVRFVLATTEPHKMPATIVGRCQRFDFRRVPVEEVAAHLVRVAEREGMTVAPDAALAIARKQGWHFDIMSTSFFLSRRALKPAAHSGMPLWQDYIFIWLAKSASDATDFFQIPTGRVVEVGTQVTV